jgi:carbamoyl-phosphate synthase large subunit
MELRKMEKSRIMPFLSMLKMPESIVVTPPSSSRTKVYLETVRRIRSIAAQIAERLKINGPFNVQFIAKNNAVKVIECNLRASRSFPFVFQSSEYQSHTIAAGAIMGKQGLRI